MKTLYGHRNRIRSIVFSPDGRLVTSGSKDEAIRLWEVETGNCIKVLRIERPYEGMNITGAKGLKGFYKPALIALGALEKIKTEVGWAKPACPSSNLCGYLTA